MDTGVLIAIIAVVAIVVIAGVVLAVRTRSKKRHNEAEHLREEVQQDTAKLEKRQALAAETDARARAADAEAEAKAAEAVRLRERAATHTDAVSSSRADLEERSKHADDLDPDVNTKAGDRDLKRPEVTPPRTEQPVDHRGAPRREL